MEDTKKEENTTNDTKKETKEETKEVKPLSQVNDKSNDTDHTHEHEHHHDHPHEHEHEHDHPHEHDLDKLTDEQKRQIQEEMAKLSLMRSKRKKGEIKETYKFWSEQPVPQFDKEIDVKFGPIIKDNKVENERKEPYPLPTGFEWADVDVTNPPELDKLYEFLKGNYVEDDDHMFRFDYNKEFLKWHLTAPGYFKNWLVSVVKPDPKKGKKKMIGFISGIPVKVCINGTDQVMAEINFLCVNQKFRENRLAPVLIKEVTRRIHLRDIWQAVYTSGTMLPKPWAKCTYFHRNLNVTKLLDIKFTYLGPNMNRARAKAIYKLPKDPSIQGLRPMEAKDVDQVTELLDAYEKKFKVHGYYNKEEVAHWFLPKKNVVYSYVNCDNDNKVTDFISFYSLPSSVLNHETHKKLYACYSFFNIANSVSFKELIKNALILAKNNGFDVYNCLNIMENQTIFTDLLFGQGDGTLKYYFYNFVCPDTKPEDLSLVLM